MEEAYTSEISAILPTTTWCNIPENIINISNELPYKSEMSKKDF
jgi:hypothetical protein